MTMSAYSTAMPELSCTVRRGERVLGFLVIHSFCRGTSRGGIRMAPDISEAEVRLLAEGMTLKFGLLGLPQGGAKAGVRADPDAPEEARYAILEEFGAALAPLLRNRVYIPGSDMGTTNPMVRRMLLSAGAQVRRRELCGRRSGHFTALSVLSAARHAAGAAGLAISGAAVSIEGFGKVGSSLAQLFTGLGARVVAVSTSRGAIYNAKGLDVARLVRAYEERGSAFVESFEFAERCSCQALFEAPVDILCPCARHNSVTAESAARIRARIISPGSNHPFDLDTERRLVATGIVAVPYWIANCGGILGETLEFAGWGEKEIAGFMHRKLGPHVRQAIEESQRTGLTPNEVAMPKAMARAAGKAAEVSGQGFMGQAMRAGLECHRRGWLPRGCVRLLSRSYFEGSVLLPFAPAA